jgi:hypothetical protein
MDDINETLCELLKEIAAILGTIAWIADWPRDHNRMSMSSLGARVHRLRRLVEDLHKVIR